MTDNILDGFDSVADQIQQNRTLALRAAAVSTGGIAPEQAARANALSDKTGQPYGVVAANLDDYAQQDRADTVTAAGQRAPAVGQFLADPRRMAIAGDEADQLVGLHDAIKPPEQDWQHQLLGDIANTGVGLWDRYRRMTTLIGGGIKPQDVQESSDVARSIPAGAVQGTGSALGGLGELYNLGERTVQRGLDAIGLGGQFFTRNEIPDWLRPGDSLIGTGSMLKQASNAIGAPAERQNTLTGIASGIGQMAPLIAQGIVAPVTLPFSTYAMGADQMADTARDKGVYGTGRADAAIATGALATGALEQVGIERLVERLPPRVRDPLIKQLADWALGAGIEAGTEAAQQVTSNAATQTFIDPNQNLGEGVADSAVQGGGAAFVLRALLGLPGIPQSHTRQSAEQMQRLSASSANATQLQNIATAAANVKLSERSPGDMQAFVQQAGGDGNVYLDAQQAQILFQSQPEVLADLVGGQQALTEQMAAGDLVIPMPKWATVVPKLPNADEVVKHSRMSPDDLSAAELESTDIEGLAKELGDPNEQAKPTDNSIQQDVATQLAATGKYTPAQAEKQAALWQAFFGRMSEATGQDATALYQRYSAGVQVGQSPNIEGSETLDQPAYHGTPHEVDRFSLQKIGTGEGNQAYGWGLYFAGNPAIADHYAQTISRDQRENDEALGTARTDLRQALKAEGYLGFDTFGEAVNALLADPKWQENWDITDPDRLRSTLETYRSRRDALQGKAYQVDVPEDSDLLDWDRPLSEQPEKVQRALQADPRARDKFYDGGREYYHSLVGRFAQDAPVNMSAASAETAYGAQRASEYLSSLGIPGLRYLDGGSRNSGTGSHNYVIWDENAVSEPTRLYQAGATSPRGQIQIAPDRSMQISLFENADKSTFIHESGHLFLEVYRDLAQDKDAPQQLRDDFDSLLKWLGVDSADKIGTEQHEQFARGFEAYLGEGKAPTPELQSVFRQFKQWILGVYQSLKNLHVQLTDDVRGVFDRMLASEDAINTAQMRTGWQPIARDLKEAKALGMTEKQFADYQKSVADELAQSKEALLARMLEQRNREHERWWKDELAGIRKEVAQEVESDPGVIATRILQGRSEAGGKPVPEALQGIKLNSADVRELGGTPRDLGQVYAKEGGLHPDAAAELLGFKNGQQLIDAMAAGRAKLAGIDAEAEARMKSRHGDMQVDGTLPDKAMAQIHDNARIKLLTNEMEVLAKLAGEPVPNRRAIWAVARYMLNDKAVKDISPARYLGTERKMAAEVARLATKGKYAEALLAKRRQALNAALFSEANKIQEESARIAKDLARKFRASSFERVGKAGVGYRKALDSLAGALGMLPAKVRQTGDVTSLKDWVDAQQDEGSITAVSDHVLGIVASGQLADMREMTIGQQREIHEAVKNITTLARNANQLRAGEKKVEWEQAQAELVGRIRDVLARKDKAVLHDDDRRMLDKVLSAPGDLMDWFLRPETAIEWLDGGEKGPFHDYLWSLANESRANQLALQREVGQKLQNTAESMPKGWSDSLNDTFAIKSMQGIEVSRKRIISIALNLGTASNRDKLMRGGYGDDGQTTPFTPENVAEMLGHLSQSDGKFIQGVWDATNSLWPRIVEMQERLSGVAPEKVESTRLNFTGADGTVSLEGGYFPMAYDPRYSGAGWNQAAESAQKMLDGLYTPAFTSKGYTKSRTEFSAPVKLDFGSVLSKHLNDVITDLTHREYLKQAMRVLKDAEIKGLIYDRLGEGAYKTLMGSVQNSVRPTSLVRSEPNIVKRWADATMTNTAVSALGLRVGLVIANSVTAPLQATARVKPRYLLKGYADAYWNFKTTRDAIYQMSPFMEERARGNDDAYSQVLSRITGNHGIRHRIMEFSMSVHRLVVPIAENGIWQGRYMQAIDSGSTPKEAVALADTAIRQTQSASAPKDLSSFEADPAFRWFKMFTGPMIVLNNRLQDSGLRGKLLGNTKSPAQALGVWFAGVMLPQILWNAVSNGGPKDDDDDGLDAGDWATWLAKGALLAPLQTIPLVSDGAAAVESILDHKPIMSRASPLTAPLIGLVRWASGSGKAIYNRFEDGTPMDAEKMTVGAVRAAGPITGIPSSQLSTSVQGVWDLTSNKYPDDNPAEKAWYLVQKRPQDKK